MQNQKIGVLLVNLGTPQSPEKKDVARYLKEFLMDGRVIDIPWFFRFLLIYLIIVPFRSKKSSNAYKSVWLQKGSPLLVYSENCTEKVKSFLGEEKYVVELCMRYQTPSVANAVQNCLKQNVSQFIVLPLFPQYSSAASGSALEKVYKEISSHWNVLPVTTVKPFYNHPAFIQCFVNRIKKSFDDISPDHILFSYHGLPERHILKSQCGEKNVCFSTPNCCDQIQNDNAHCYRAQCIATTSAIASQMNLEQNSYSNSFQSRLGRTKWIEPYTDEVLPQLAKKGIKKLLIVCPAFVADCLETLEEIEIRAKEEWLACGGKELCLVPSLNAEPDWVESLAQIIKEHSV